MHNHNVKIWTKNELIRGISLIYATHKTMVKTWRQQRDELK
jgi:hypothetical protein